MSEPITPGKMSLIDQLTAISFTTPLVVCLIDGAKNGFVGALIGIGLGGLLGVVSAYGFRRSVRWTADRWFSGEKLRAFWGRNSETLFWVAAGAWIVGVGCSAVIIGRAVFHGLAV